MLRLSIMGLSELERGRGDPSEQDIREARALCSTTLVDTIRLLDLYLTGELTRRESDGTAITDLVHSGMPWDARLSNEVGSVVKLFKPTAEDTKRNRQCVLLDLNGPLDENIKTRWRDIDKDTRTEADLKPLGEEIYLLMQGKGFGSRKDVEEPS